MATEVPYQGYRINHWRDQIVQTIDELLALEEDWDSYGANRISPKACERTLALLDAIMTDDTAAPQVAPLSCGGIQLEWHQDGYDIEIGIQDEGQPSVYCDEPGAQEGEEWMLGDLTRIRRIVRGLRDGQ
jgi:hypothetical protein